LQTGANAPVQGRLGRFEDPAGWVHWIEVPRQRGFEPLRTDGRVWVRRERSTVEPSASELQDLYNLFGYILTEGRAIEAASESDIDVQVFRSYLAALGLEVEEEPQPSITQDLLNHEVVADIGGELHATLYGILAFGHEGTHFCAGANLALILELAKAKQFGVIEEISHTFQSITQAIKYAPFPVVAAPFSVTLGGGFETIACCDRVVPLAELYCGAVEVGVGLIPGAGGNLRLLTHLSERMPPRQIGPMAAVQRAFETIGFAKVSTSAHEAVELGYLRPDSPIVLSRDHLIARAKQEVLALADGYAPPAPPELVPPGEGGRLAIESAIEGFLKAGTISEHDALVAKKLAWVLTAGDRGDGMQPVPEQYFLDLEREAFVSLAGEEKSQARMAHMLKTGKPLRN